MANHEKIQTLLLRALDDVNQQLPVEKRFRVSPETVLFGLGGVLDSLGLVNLIVAVEQHLEEEWGATLVLADERALAQKTSPFRTVATLVEYIAQQLDEYSNA